MKKTFRKVVFREIRYSFSRFLAIFAIVALGVGFLAGLLGTTPDMRATADQYYDDCNIADIRLVSTMGLTDEDAQAIRELPGVEAVMPAYTQDVLVETPGKDTVAARFSSIPADQTDNAQNQNRLQLVEGRMPEKAGECVIVDRGDRVAGSVGIGDVLTISQENENIEDTFSTTEYTVVGVVQTAYYTTIEEEATTIGTGSISLLLYTLEENFALDVYTDLFITASEAAPLTAFTPEYEEAVNAVKQEVEGIAEVREQARRDEIVAEATEELNDAKQEYQEEKADAEQQLADAQKEIEDGRAEIEQAEQDLEDARKQVEQGEKTLSSEKSSYEEQIAAAEKEIEEGEKAIEEGRTELEANKVTLDEAKTALDEAKQMIAMLPPEQQAAALEQLKPQEEQYEQGLAAYNAGVQTLEQKEAELEQGKSELENQKKSAQSQFSQAEQELADARAEIAQGEEELETARQELAEGEQEYQDKKAEADEQFAEAEQEIKDAEQDIAEIEMPEWIVLTRGEFNVGYISFDSNAEKIEAIATIFPLFFFLVAALVALTTMTRMVEEQRLQIGTLKALGYGKGAIAAKFLIYAAAASVAGCVVGLLLGFHIFPAVIWNAYGIMYTMPPIQMYFQWDYAIFGSVCALVCTLGATMGACYNALKERPARLMLPRAPKPGKRIWLERIRPLWSHLPFTYKVTARNLIRYKKRFFMTVIGIAGCTALLVTGFGLRDSIGDIVDKQFGEVYRYNLSVSANEEAALDGEQINVVLSENTQGYMKVAQENAEIEGGNAITILVPQDETRIQDFIALQERATGDVVAFDSQSAVITEKIADTLGIRIGDTIDVTLDSGETAQVTITGITENYVQSYLYLSPGLYEEAFGKTLEYKEILGIVPDATDERRDEIATQILQCEDIASASFTDSIRDSFGDMVNNIDYIVIVLIISAGALAFIVLYNLTNINITERMRELATIKVLGFFDRELSAYIYRETAILSVIGAGVGLILGIFLHAFVVQTAEVDAVMFGREIAPLSYIISAAMTLAFTGIVDLVMYRKLQKIDMVESLKENE